MIKIQCIDLFGFFAWSFQIFFWGKFLAQKGTKIKLLKFYEKSIHGFFLIISTKLQQKGSKLTAIFFWKILCLGFLTKRVRKLVLKLHKKSLKWIENDALSFFWFFHEVTTAQRQEVRQFFLIFVRNLGMKGPKMGPRLEIASKPFFFFFSYKNW